MSHALNADHKRYSKWMVCIGVPMTREMLSKKVIEAQIKLIEIAKGIEEGLEPDELLGMIAATLDICSSLHDTEILWWTRPTCS